MTRRNPDYTLLQHNLRATAMAKLVLVEAELTSVLNEAAFLRESKILGPLALIDQKLASLLKQGLVGWAEVVRRLEEDPLWEEMYIWHSLQLMGHPVTQGLGEVKPFPRGKKNPRSTGYVAAKIRANTARRNGKKR